MKHCADTHNLLITSLLLVILVIVIILLLLLVILVIILTLLTLLARNLRELVLLEVFRPDELHQPRHSALADAAVLRVLVRVVLAAVLAVLADLDLVVLVDLLVVGLGLGGRNLGGLLGDVLLLALALGAGLDCGLGGLLLAEVGHCRVRCFG